MPHDSPMAAHRDRHDQRPPHLDYAITRLSYFFNAPRSLLGKPRNARRGVEKQHLHCLVAYHSAQVLSSACRWRTAGMGRCLQAARDEKVNARNYLHG